VGLIALICGSTPPSPVVNFRPSGSETSVRAPHHLCAYMVLYAASTSLPGLLQSLFGYDALKRGLGHVAGRLLCRRRNACRGFVLEGDGPRWVIIAGLLIMAAGNY